ncbi:hypothetical protein CEUSTIGMA_g6957.t1 [Chlamydomonas eustigma]|uniref:Increased DNA methylation 1 C-terminal domain-containing protein n=1 Tax=Chlamydomonas eustigma TaxID=1157962 RepID=A0A250X8X6_9CHLO|nr:hypothetical protein CEUSTIGMA_g6957.t1 [Chlamydomonas eustigma]|eukprot:GAX79516.1 hypothetical protein CEUSTIGMA_g6957.t1 [Chlamydomonas eustigma]
MIEGPEIEERALTSHTDRSATSAAGPVSAALLDVYGADVAKLFAITTHPGHRGKGHARALVLDALAPSLSAAGVKQLAVCVDEDDEDAMVMWAEFGFEPLQPVDKRRLGWWLPQFSRDANSFTIEGGAATMHAILIFEG